MPEGPSLYLVKESLELFINKKIKQASGNAKVNMALLSNKVIIDFKTWGKQLFIFIRHGPVIRIHFLMFGSYSIDKQSPTAVCGFALKWVKEKYFFIPAL